MPGEGRPREGTGEQGRGRQRPGVRVPRLLRGGAQAAVARSRAPVCGGAGGYGGEETGSERGPGAGVCGPGWGLRACGAGGIRTIFVSQGPRAGPSRINLRARGGVPSRGAWAMGISGRSTERGPPPRPPIEGWGEEGDCASEAPPATVKPGATARARAGRESAPSAGSRSPRCLRLHVPAREPRRQLCKPGGGAAPRGRGWGRGGRARARSANQEAWGGPAGRDVGARLSARAAAPAPKCGALRCARTPGLVGAPRLVAPQRKRGHGTFLLHKPWSLDLVATRPSAHGRTNESLKKCTSNEARSERGGEGRRGQPAACLVSTRCNPVRVACGRQPRDRETAKRTGNQPALGQGDSVPGQGDSPGPGLLWLKLL